jgi:HlyD family secretion protein
MDREIDPAHRKRQVVRRATLSAIVVAAIAAIFVWVPGFIRPSLSRSRIRTARVDAGPIESTISASGTVVPEFEQVLSSPINARVVKIMKRPGAVVTRGEPILELDVSESVLALERVTQQVELKQNQQAKAKLDLENTLISLKSQWEIKNLEFKSASQNSARNRELHKQGLVSSELLSQAELLEEKNRYELKQLEESKHNAGQSTDTQLEGLALEMKTLEKERTEARRQLELATTKSDRDGVLTWVVPEEGATIQKGAVLARIADLNSFLVQATVSDIHASRLSVGMPVRVRINDSFLEGEVSSVDPTIKDGVMTMLIALKEKASSLLRSNLRVDVLIAAERKDRVLRIKKGPFANSEGLRDVFVIRGDAAIKTSVRLGISSFEDYEVVEGLIEGDEVIISDMTDYMHAREVRLKQ